jgi:hypothetical protein
VDVLGQDDRAAEASRAVEDEVDERLDALGVGVALVGPLAVGLEHHRGSLLHYGFYRLTLLSYVL